MEFDNANLVIIDTMNRDEARAFVLFLASEILRHREDIIKAKALARLVADRFILTTPDIVESIYKEAQTIEEIAETGGSL